MLDLWVQVKELFDARKLVNKFADFQKQVIVAATNHRRSIDPKFAAMSVAEEEALLEQAASSGETATASNASTVSVIPTPSATVTSAALIAASAAAVASPAVLVAATPTPANAAASRGMFAETPAASPASVDRSAAAAARDDTDLSNQRRANR